MACSRGAEKVFAALSMLVSEFDNEFDLPSEATIAKAEVNGRYSQSGRTVDTKGKPDVTSCTACVREDRTATLAQCFSSSLPSPGPETVVGLARGELQNVEMQEGIRAKPIAYIPKVKRMKKPLTRDHGRV